ncbi:MAG: PEP-CTERM sorting domain-containing protein [Akkermansiaceae bacterium]
MKNPLFLSTISMLALASTTNAAIVSIESIRGNGINGSGLTLVNSSTDANGTRTYSFTITGDLDGGTANDTLSFDVVASTYSGSNVGTNGDLTGATQVTATENRFFFSQSANGNTADFMAGTIGINNITYTGGSDTANNITAAYVEGSATMRKLGAGTGTYYTGLETTALTLGGNTSIVLLDPSSNGTLSIANDDIAGVVRYRNLSFDIEVSDAVPEPSSAVLLGLGSLGFLLRRRR